MTDLAGARVLITGASSGIGAETAGRLAVRGADVALLARSLEGLEKAAEDVRRAGRKAVIVQADVSVREEAEVGVDEAAAALGGLDAVIVNAGSAAYGRFREITPEDFDDTVQVTFLGAVYTVRAALPHLEKTGGVVVATGSVASMWPSPLMVPYAAAKHGLRGFLNSLRIELKATRSSVRIAQVHPGPVDTPFWKHVTPASVMPPVLPSAYDAGQVADALVDAVESPRAEHIVGWGMRAAHLARTVARPFFEAGAVAAAKHAMENPADEEPGDALNSPTGKGRIDGGIKGEKKTAGTR